jgi:decaprenylphospho-beta-D-ribofuranose 2-oxidase
MLRADPRPAATSATAAGHGIAYTTATLRGWGGGGGAPATLVRPPDLDAVRAVLPLDGPGARAGDAPAGAIARGMGRSYGDAAQLAGGVVVDMTGLRHFELDPDRGTVTAQAGATIGELLAALVPAGWILPVVPGTQHVTVGGAIASDIHGKNHGSAGTFGSRVRALGLLTSAGEVRELEAVSGDELLAATVGGMGLTGVILWARLDLERIAAPLLSVDTVRAGTLDDALDALAAPGGRYRVAWLDLLGRRPARGVVTRAERVADGFATGALPAGPTVRARGTVPRWWPHGVLRPGAVRAFNALRFHRSPRSEIGRPMGFGAHMFPLDSLDAWPRLYGRDGLLQYQLAVPRGRENVLETAIERLRRAGIPCYLATLKDLGPANDAPLSFPIPGWTLALDLPRGVAGIEVALRGLDQLVAAAGGRVYLTKDARLSRDVVGAMYPRLEEWRAARDRADPDGVWRSDLGLRTGLIEAGLR